MSAKGTTIALAPLTAALVALALPAADGWTASAAAVPASTAPAALAQPASTDPAARAQPAATDDAAGHERGRVTRLSLKRSPYGRVLFANGFAMYVFTADQRGESDCYGKCAKAWPPLRPRGELVAGRGVDEDLITTSRRRGGARQVSYAGNPIYGYVDDPRGEVFCHDVVEFGGTWYAVLKSGRPAP